MLTITKNHNTPKTASRENTPSKNALWEFFADFTYSTTIFANETQYSCRKNHTYAYEPAPGVHYYGYRYYSPSTGRWITRDPMEEGGGVNIYTFVMNRSVVLWDYIGLSSHSDCEQLVNYFLKKNRSQLPMRVVVGDKEDFKSKGPKDKCLVRVICKKCSCKSHYDATTQKLPDQVFDYKDYGDSNTPKTYTVTSSKIVICENKVGSDKFDYTLMLIMHEMQHAKDNCDDFRMYNCDAESKDFFDCECANSLCREVRAYTQNRPGMKKAEIINFLIWGSVYWSNTAYCGMGTGRHADPKKVSDRLLDDCDISNGILPRTKGLLKHHAWLAL